MYKLILNPFLTLLLLTSCNNPRADKNYVNLRQIKKGMHMNKVIKIMGQPDTIIIEPENTNKLWFMYESSAGMSDNFYIYISKKDSIVEGINDGN
jgi:hypothetical protein